MLAENLVDHGILWLFGTLETHWNSVLLQRIASELQLLRRIASELLVRREILAGFARIQGNPSLPVIKTGLSLENTGAVGIRMSHN